MMFSSGFNKHGMQKQIIGTKSKTAHVQIQPKTNPKGHHTPSSSMHHPFQESRLQQPPMTPRRTHLTPHQPSHGGSNKCLSCYCWFVFFVFASLPRRFFSNLRTACSETLMLRERKASMAERSLSSLTGELLLLATDAAGFATFPARRLGTEVGNTLGGKGVGCHDDGSGLGAIVEGVVFQKYTRRQQESSPEHRSNTSSWRGANATQGKGRRAGHRAQTSKEGRGQEQCGGGSRMTQPPPKPQPQRSTQSQEAAEEEGQIKKQKTNIRWKLTAVHNMSQITGERRKKRGFKKG